MGDATRVDDERCDDDDDDDDDAIGELVAVGTNDDDVVRYTHRTRAIGD
jgi:hypothetical protein